VNYHAFDTETINCPGRGEPCLLAGTDGLETRKFLFPRNWEHCWNFLAFRRGRTPYIAYNMDFDALALLHFLPDEALEGLAFYNHTFWRGYSIRFIPKKVFSCHREDRNFVIYDLAQYFGCSLNEAAQKYLGEKKEEIPESWYKEMDVALKDSRREKILKYADQDVRLLYLLGRLLMNSLTSLGIPTGSLVSSGTLAKKVFGKYLSKVKISREINTLWSKGFFGGRVEVGRLGKVNHVKLYDIVSAYPSEIVKLQSLEGLQMVETLNPSQDAVYGLYRVTAHIGVDHHWGPLAVRDPGGSIYYPVGVVRTWICRPALDLLRRYRFHLVVEEGYEWIGKSKGLVFNDGVIEKYFEARKEPHLKLAAKLLLNSIYGITCEQRSKTFESDIGTAKGFSGHCSSTISIFGRYANFIFASHITEAIRMRLYDVLSRFGKRIYFCATDSVLMSRSCSLPIGKKLGEWGLKSSFKSGFLLGCGRYLLEEPAAQYALRGFPVNKKTFDRIKNSERKYIDISILDNMSLRQWANSYGIGDFGVLRAILKRLTISDNKRCWKGEIVKLADVATKSMESSPWIMARPGDNLKELFNARQTGRN